MKPFWQKIILLVSLGSIFFAVPVFAQGRQVNLSSGANYSELSITNRSQWGADETLSGWDPQYRKIRRIIVHHTATSNSETDYGKVARNIFIMHSLKNDWGDIGYNYLIAPSGEIIEGRKGGDGAVGAHAYGYNTGSIGIAFIGTFTTHSPTSAAREAFKKLITEKSLIHGLELEWGDINATVTGHRFSPGSNTACPGNKLLEYLPVMVSDAEKRRLAKVGGTINTQRLTTQSELINYYDNVLRLNFTQPITESQIRSRLPKFSGVEKISVSGNQALLTVDSRATQFTETLWDTPDRLRLLHTIFNLDPKVESADVVEEFKVSEFRPANNELYTDPSLTKLRLEFSRPIVKGTGDVLLRKFSDNSTVLTWNMASAQIYVNSSVLNLLELVLPDNTLEAGQQYYVQVCSDCIKSVQGVDFPGFTGNNIWRFTVNERPTPPAGLPVYRFYSDSYRSHFYTIDSDEKEKLETSDPNWRFEGVAFRSIDGGANCTAPTNAVYRFWSDNFKRHFFTIKVAERDKLINSDPNWDYEGVAFCAYSSEEYGISAIYRFYSDQRRSHFFTIKKTERNNLIVNQSGTWRYERISFYALPKENI